MSRDVGEIGVSCKCACGEWLFAISDDLNDKRDAVVFHMKSLRHMSWRWRQEC